MPEGFVLQPGYRIRSGIPVIQLFGRLASGEAFLVEDDRFRPYFFAEPRARALAAAAGAEVRARSRPCASGSPPRVSPSTRRTCAFRIGS